MSSAVSSKYSIKAQQLGSELNATRLRLAEENSRCKAANARLSESQASFKVIKERIANSKKTENHILDRELLKNAQHALRKSKKQVVDSNAQAILATGRRDGVARELSSISTKVDFLNEKISLAKKHHDLRIENSRSEELTDIAIVQDAKLNGTHSAHSLADEEDLTVDSLDLVSGSIDAQKIDLLPAVNIDRIEIGTNFNSSLSSASHSDHSANSNARHQSEPTDPQVQSKQENGVVTASFSVGTNQYRVELTSSQQGGPVSVYIEPGIGQTVGQATLIKIKDELKRKNIAFSSIVVGRGA